MHCSQFWRLEVWDQGVSMVRWGPASGSQAPFIKVIIPFMRAPLWWPHCLITPQRPKFNMWILGRHIQVIATILHRDGKAGRSLHPLILGVLLLLASHSAVNHRVRVWGYRGVWGLPDSHEVSAGCSPTLPAKHFFLQGKGITGILPKEV